MLMGNEEVMRRRKRAHCIGAEPALVKLELGQGTRVCLALPHGGNLRA